MGLGDPDPICAHCIHCHRKNGNGGISYFCKQPTRVATEVSNHISGEPEFENPAGIRQSYPYEPCSTFNGSGECTLFFEEV